MGWRPRRERRGEQRGEQAFCDCGASELLTGPTHAVSHAVQVDCLTGESRCGSAPAEGSRYATGRSTVKVEPPPVREATPIDPLICETSSRQMKRPSPVPPMPL